MPTDRPKPSKWRRLWRRRLRRRPLLPFLVAALVAIDAVVIFGLNDALPLDAMRWWTLLFGVMMGQANLLGFWVGASRRALVVRSIVAFVAIGCLATVVELLATDPPGIFVSFLMASLLASALISALVHRLAAAFRHGLRPQTRYRYSIGILLLLMTVTPLIALAVQEGRWNVLLEWRVATPAVIETSLATLLLILSIAIRSTLWLGVTYALLGVVGCVAWTQDSPNNIDSPLYYLGLLVGIGGFLVGVRANTATRPHDRTDGVADTRDTETKDATPAEAENLLRYDDAHPSVLKMHIDLTG